ncbi:MAG: hypothetical protein WBQ87_18905, partial [Candidatus Sulfotelmatobacter sp.]
LYISVESRRDGTKHTCGEQIIHERSRRGGAGINDSLPLEEVEFKGFKASGAIVHCPLTVQ